MSADSMIASFAAGTGNGQYPLVPRAEVVRGLRERVGNPDTMSQGVSSLCGPTSLFHCLIRDDAEAYVKYVIDLYTTGRATIRQLTVRPGADCRNANPRGVPAVDWVALASLRDSENTFLDYQAPQNEAAGITLPNNLAAWLRAVGYRSVLNNTNVFITKGEDEIRAMARLLGQGYKVCMFVNSNIVQHTLQGGGFFTIPDHWVELIRLQGIHNDRVTGAVLWTWAQTFNLPHATVDAFDDNFFGYVAARGYSPQP